MHEKKKKKTRKKLIKRISGFVGFWTYEDKIITKIEKLLNAAVASSLLNNICYVHQAE